jgi:hypothetical protein
MKTKRLKRKQKAIPGGSLKPDGSPFRAGTGMLGATEPGQLVTAENAHWLPPGSVVRLDDGGRLIHLHDGLWLWCAGYAHCYDRLEYHLRRLPGVLCHIPVNTEVRHGEKNT